MIYQKVNCQQPIYPFVIKPTLISLVFISSILPAIAETESGGTRENIEVAQTNTSLDKTLNGVPVVNIAPPDNGGVSHNTYHQFNVGTEGVILNNSLQEQTKTQLGGKITSNPHFSDKTADTIINEVVSPNPSALNGMLEVAGKTAQVIVANPYGITCDGCAFIHTPSVILSTGTWEFDAEKKQYNWAVTGGTITFNGQGVDARKNDYFSLISRTLEINAQIKAKDLKVSVGVDQINNQGSVNHDASPRLAINTSALGGMYADSISLISTEQGPGVNLGAVNVQQDINIVTQGHINLNKVEAKGNMAITGNQLNINGMLASGQMMTLKSSGDINLDHAELLTNKKMVIEAGGKISSTESKIDVASKKSVLDFIRRIHREEEISLQGSHLAINKTMISANSLQISSTGEITQDNDSRFNAQNMQISGKKLDFAGLLSTDNDLTITGDTLHGSEKAAIDSKNNIAIRLKDEGV